MKKDVSIFKSALISSLVGFPFTVLAGVVVALIVSQSDIKIPTKTSVGEENQKYIRETFTSPQGQGTFELVKSYTDLDPNNPGRVITYYVYDIPIEEFEKLENSEEK